MPHPPPSAASPAGPPAAEPAGTSFLDLPTEVQGQIVSRALPRRYKSASERRAAMAPLRTACRCGRRWVDVRLAKLRLSCGRAAAPVRLLLAAGGGPPPPPPLQLFAARCVPRRWPRLDTLQLVNPGCCDAPHLRAILEAAPE